jgi:flagellar hook-basal body complex protein FliE
MTIFEPNQVQGNEMQLLRTDPSHRAGKYEPLPAEETETAFREVLMGRLEEVNGLQQAHEALSVQAVVDPDSVEAHDLTIAAAKATTALSITKNVVDRVIQAYRDITNLR